MQALSLHCPIHGILMAWPDAGGVNAGSGTTHCWMYDTIDVVDRCGAPLALQVWPDPLTPTTEVGIVEPMSTTEESSDPAVIRFLLERGDYHVIERAVAALCSVAQCASCGSYERIVR